MVQLAEQPQAIDTPTALPLAQDLPVSEEELVAGEDVGVLTHGMLTALGVSVPLWLGLVWLGIRLIPTLPLR